MLFETALRTEKLIAVLTLIRILHYSIQSFPSTHPLQHPVPQYLYYNIFYYRIIYHYLYLHIRIYHYFCREVSRLPFEEPNLRLFSDGIEREPVEDDIRDYCKGIQQCTSWYNPPVAVLLGVWNQL